MSLADLGHGPRKAGAKADDRRSAGAYFGNGGGSSVPQNG